MRLDRLFFVLLLCLGVCLSCSDRAAKKTYTNSLGMEFVLVPAGSFIMGSDKSVASANDDETFRHLVSITTPFYMGKYEVTQAQWMAVMGDNPSRFRGENNPVEQVSWEDIQEFIRRLNAKEGHSRYRLPTEAEWEYAARAGTESLYSFGDAADALGQNAWYRGNSGDTPHPVGQKQPTAWGLYDMHGNVCEWVQDWYGDTYYRESPATDPQGSSSDWFRVIRGGGWYDPPELCRSAHRSFTSPEKKYDDVGFRLALSPE